MSAASSATVVPQTSKKDGMECAVNPLSEYTSISSLHIKRTSRVSACRDPRGKPCVLKEYIIDKLSRDELAQVEREMGFLMSPELRHSNIVSGYASFRTATSIYLAQEYCSMGDLFDIASRFPNRRVPESITVEKILKPICEAVAFMHSIGIIHRDIKPENIVVATNGDAKLCDFGLAIDTRIDVPVSKIGTLEYMAPELVRLPAVINDVHLKQLRKAPKGRYDEKVDIWAIGCLAYELVSGCAPFNKDNGADKCLPRNFRIEHAIISGDWDFNMISPANSDDAVQFISAALTYKALYRPSATVLLASPWMQRSTTQKQCSTPAAAQAAVQAAKDSVSTLMVAVSDGSLSPAEGAAAAVPSPGAPAPVPVPGPSEVAEVPETARSTATSATLPAAAAAARAAAAPAAAPSAAEAAVESEPPPALSEAPAVPQASALPETSPSPAALMPVLLPFPASAAAIPSAHSLALPRALSSSAPFANASISALRRRSLGVEMFRPLVSASR